MTRFALRIPNVENYEAWFFSIAFRIPDSSDLVPRLWWRHHPAKEEPCYEQGHFDDYYGNRMNSNTSYYLFSLELEPPLL